MTREEAIEVIKDIYNYTKWDTHITNEARTMAIKALEQESCEDAISRQAAIEIIDNWLSCADYNEAERGIMRAARNMVLDLPSVTPNQRWIPVSERLPEKGEYGKVLVTYIPSGGTLWTTVIIAHYSDLMGIAKPSFHIGDVGKESFQNITKQVIAWMPLPEPYKAESEEQENDKRRSNHNHRTATDLYGMCS